LIVEELMRYNVKIAGLQKTKWFRSVVYDTAGTFVLMSGKLKPVNGESF